MLNLGLILNKLMERLNIQGNSLHYVGGSDVLPPPLSKEEEEKYIDLLLKKDKEARDKLIEHNLRLVAHITKKYEK